MIYDELPVRGLVCASLCFQVCLRHSLRKNPDEEKICSAFEWISLVDLSSNFG